MTTVAKRIETKNYVATDHDVELLAAEHLAGAQTAARGDGAYLRILVAALKAQFGNGTNRRRKMTDEDMKAHSEHLAATHTRYYAWVLKGVTTPDIIDDETLEPAVRRVRQVERSSRAGFARSAASTLQAFIKAGGDVRGLTVEDVTKTWLRAWVAQVKAPNEPLRLQAVRAVSKRYVNEARKLCEDDIETGRAEIERTIRELQTLLLDVPGGTLPLPQVAVGVESTVFQPRRGARFKPPAATA